MTEEYNRAEKQAYLREQIIDVGYDPESFVEFMQIARGTSSLPIENGGDVDMWTLDELKDVVTQYIEKNPLRQAEEEPSGGSPSGGSTQPEAPAVNSRRILGSPRSHPPTSR